MNRSPLVFSDLDGTLLDARTYSYQQAAPALDLLRTRGIPLIIVSSKTRAEIEVYRRRLDNQHPFISENGGGVFVPKGYFPFPVPGNDENGYIVMRLGIPYAETRRIFVGLRERAHITVQGFGDLTAKQVAELTGLSIEEAVLAKQRDFSEPFVFTGDPAHAFLRSIETAGLHWTQGKLFHIMGDHDKGRAVQMVRDLYVTMRGSVRTIGLGDGLNDLPFLQLVDHAVLVKREDGTHDPRVEAPGMLLTDGIGPAGWNDAVMHLLDAS